MTQGPLISHYIMIVTHVIIDIQYTHARPSEAEIQFIYLENDLLHNMDSMLFISVY